jgi:hypothetical protein
MIARRSLLRVLVSLCVVTGGLLCVWDAPASAQRMHEFSKSFGGEGSGDGQLSRPGALAVNEETGDVYVIDRGNERVEIFSSSGAYVGQFNGSDTPAKAFSWASGETEGAIAVDNSKNPSDPSKGDVYVLDFGNFVIDKFTPGGVYLGQVTGESPTVPFSHAQFDEAPRDVGVDSNGELYVAVGYHGGIDVFNDTPTNEYVKNVRPYFPVINLGGAVAAPVPSGIGLAFDSEGDFYLGSTRGQEKGGEHTPFAKFSARGEILRELVGGETSSSALAVDLSSNDVYADDETNVAVFAPSGAPIEQFGAAQMQASEGIAVDSSTGTVYASEAVGQEVDLFTAFVVPDVTTAPASHFGETSVTVGGTVDPDGLPVTSCVFEYGTSNSYGQSEACSPSPGSGDGPVAVSAQLKGLEPLTEYHFRLNVSNANGSNQGQDRTFVTPEPVAISEANVSDVSSASALFGAQIDPHGADTTYRFEYGTSVSYGESLPVPAGDLGAGRSSELAAVRAQNLAPETTYHVRVAASNVLGTVYGPDETFTTQGGGGAFMLPDGREWEMVSPPDKDGASILGPGEGGETLVQASEAGDAVTYVTNAPIVANPAGNPSPTSATQVLSRRVAGGWSSEDIATPHDAATGADRTEEYRFFSNDLSQAIVEPLGATPLSPAATEKTPYVREGGDGVYVPLVTANNVPPGRKFSGSEANERGAEEEDVHVRTVTPDFSHMILLSKFALTEDAIDTTPNGLPNLYEWSAGKLQLVNVLPGLKPGESGKPSAGGVLGAGNTNIVHALSNDGSRVFWSTASAEDGPLYMRDTVSGKTLQVDAPAPGVAPPPANKARFQIASADGSKVFFTDEQPLTPDSTLTPTALGNSSDLHDLYVCQIVEEAGEPKCDLRDLSVDPNPGEEANVQKVLVGASEDGSVVYFVATGALASGAQPGKDNLYVESETGSTWSTRLVAVLSPEDELDWEPEEQAHDPFRLASRVSPNGRYLAFMSDLSLTHYDNRDANSGQPDEEAFLYDEATGHLVCASCNPTGARPNGIFYSGQHVLLDYSGAWANRWIAATIPSYEQVATGSGRGPIYQTRSLTDAGRLFFNSTDALVAQDTNGKADVYEYEPTGDGSCTRATGCVALISSGTSSEESAFLDASGIGPGGEEGEDVFFLTASRLTSQDADTTYDVYDAHECSAALPCATASVSPPPCTSGDSCKAAPSPQPAIFGAPSSATFSGAGNVVTSSPVQSAGKPKAKKKSAKKKKPAKRKRKGKSSRDRKSLSARSRR